MPLQIIGAGLGRTGTHSLKLALERLLGSPCYHMEEVFKRPEHVAVWQAAANGEPTDWDSLFEGYAAEVDWPASAFYRELMDAYPDAPVLLSVRSSESWWESASSTIFPTAEKVGEMMPAWYAMIRTLFERRFTSDWRDKDASIAAYERHNAEVRATVPANRLIVWQPGDDWAPLCRALGLPIPNEPFPRSNTREEFLARAKQETLTKEEGWDATEQPS
jgi:hypothetical protein